MDIIPVEGALSEAELDRLEFLLAELPFAMDIETMDGYFSALIAGPEMVAPSRWLPEVLGGEDSEGFGTLAAAEETLSLLMRRWNEIAGNLANDEVTMPILLEEDGMTPANGWAEGFLQGTEMCRAAWSALFENEEHGGCLLPVMILYHEHDEDEELRPPAITPEHREELIAHMIGGVMHAYRYFRGEDFLAAAAARWTQLGRNAPCPCGSGKRYKRCCGRVM